MALNQATIHDLSISDIGKVVTKVRPTIIDNYNDFRYTTKLYILIRLLGDEVAIIMDDTGEFFIVTPEFLNHWITLTELDIRYKISNINSPNGDELFLIMTNQNMHKILKSFNDVYRYISTENLSLITQCINLRRL